MAFTSLAKVILLVSLLISRARAQTAHCNVGYEWNRNSLGEDACALSSRLDAACRGLLSYNFPPISGANYYLPPRKNNTGDLTCDCNTVMYNFYMACISCQGATIYSWQLWITACDTVFIGRYPSNIPQGTAVPRWAYFDSTTAINQTYDTATMIRIGRDPEELPKPINSVFNSGGTSSIPSSTGNSTSGPGVTSTSSVSTKSGTNVGAIVGGVVGSVVPLTILAFVVYFCMRYRRGKDVQQRQSQVFSPNGTGSYKQQTSSMYGPPPIQTVPFAPYNPSDPSTFPPQSPQSSVTYTTPIHPVHGAYSGTAEV